MKLSHMEAAQFFASLKALMHAGLPLAEGIHLLAREESGEKQSLLEAMLEIMDSGEPLHAAMEQTRAFPEAACAMIRIGQTTGRLEDTLGYLASFYAERVQTSRQIKNALGYPALIFLLMLTVIAVLLMEVLPVFDRVYASLGSSLTGLAGGLLKLGQGLKGALPVLFILLALGLVLWLLFRRVKPLRESVSNWLRSRFGDAFIAKQFNNAQFAYAMAMGLGSGLGLDDSLELAKRLLSHIPGAARRCQLCQEALAQELGLAQAMEKAQLLEPRLSRMLDLGLRSGSGEKTMGDIAETLSRQAKESLEDAVARIEPAMVLLCSVLVGIILLAVMLPLMDIMGAIG